MIRECKYLELEDGKCTDLIDGIIYINSKHSVNKMVFGTEYEYKIRMDNDKIAQFTIPSANCRTIRFMIMLKEMF